MRLLKLSVRSLFFLPIVCWAQSFTNTGLPLGLSPNAILKVNQNFVNSGNILNEGSIEVGGTWMNTGIYSNNGVGVVDLNGEIVQTLNDSDEIEILRLSGGNKTLQTDLVVETLILNGSQLIIEEGFSLEIPPSGSIQRQPDDYVIGKLVMHGNQTYPIGTPNYYLPVTINNQTTEGASLGIKAVEQPLVGTLDNTIAEVAPFHWEFDETDDELNVSLGFEQADFLGELENAMVVEAEAVDATVYSLYQDSVSGSLDFGIVANAPDQQVTHPFLSIGRRFVPADKPPVKVLNLVSPNQDGKNDFLFIENIEAYPESLVIIYDRWGTKVYEVSGYKNSMEESFRGFGNLRNKNELTEGTYYFVIRSEGEKLTSGFFELMR